MTCKYCGSNNCELIKAKNFPNKTVTQYFCNSCNQFFTDRVNKEEQ